MSPRRTTATPTDTDRVPDEDENGLELICEECGDDLVCEGYRYCSDCLERLGHAADG